MAAVQTAPASMTLGRQDSSSRMYTSIIHHSPETNCVIVSASGLPQKTIVQAKRPLAPAPERSSSGSTASVLISGSDLRCKRRIQFVPYSGVPQQSASVARRNARERNRVKQVNNGFATLRQHIPISVVTALTSQGGHGTGRGAHKKLSKVETLRLAVEYIRSLKQMLEESDSEKSPTPAVSGENVAVQDNRLFAGSPDSSGSQQFNPYMTLLPTPPSSVASASPTPSHTSDGSTSSNYMQGSMYKHTGFDNFDAKSPEDDELLDAIFYWQESE